MDDLVWNSIPTTNPQWQVGALVRWREAARGRWTYSYFRGVREGVIELSLAPAGPITIRRVYGEFQFATCVPETQGSGDAS